MRTGVTAVKGRCPRPLDDGDVEDSYDGRRPVGGGKRDRTADLLHAMQALSQLSYTPTQGRELYHAERCARSRSSTRLLPARASTGPRLGVCTRPNTIIRNGIASFGSLSLCLSITAWIALMTDSARQSASAANAAASSASAGRTSSVTESRAAPRSP